MFQPGSTNQMSQEMSLREPSRTPVRKTDSAGRVTCVCIWVATPSSRGPPLQMCWTIAITAYSNGLTDQLYLYIFVFPNAVPLTRNHSSLIRQFKLVPVQPEVDKARQYHPQQSNGASPGQRLKGFVQPQTWRYLYGKRGGAGRIQKHTYGLGRHLSLSLYGGGNFGKLNVERYKTAIATWSG